MISPLDDRYYSKVKILDEIFSEYGLMKARTIVEIQWLLFLVEQGIAPKLSASAIKKLQKLEKNFDQKSYKAIKAIEAKTNHDVKAVEMFVRKSTPKSHWSWIHFACTSEDINNTSYGLMLSQGREILVAELKNILKDLKKKSRAWKNASMLCRTHGQTATPSTMGKEIGVFYLRILHLEEVLRNFPITAKINGATGNYAAHVSAFPKKNWIKLSQQFVTKKLGLTWNPLTTQIENHDHQASFLDQTSLLSSVLIDLCRDIWGYVSLGYFGQKVIAGEVGSSTMPHKVNPIDFENAEGNLKIARGLARTLSDELPISRWQRDLTDSTLQRNFGVVFGHVLLAFKSLQKGLRKLELKRNALKKDLQNAPEVLTEAVQTVLRAHGHADAYDQLKKFSRGKALKLEEVHAFIQQTKIPEKAKKDLLALTPETYTGLSQELVEVFVK